MSAPETPDLPALLAEAADLEAAIRRLGAPDAGQGAALREELESRVQRLCIAVPSLPPADARALAGPLAQLIAALDEAAGRLRGGGTGDSGSGAATARQAAAAYGSAASRRRRGF